MNPEKPTHYWHTSPSKTILLDPSQTVLISDQVLKYQSPWGPFSFILVRCDGLQLQDTETEEGLKVQRLDLEFQASEDYKARLLFQIKYSFSFFLKKSPVGQAGLELM